jgi:hypothetical protein
VEHTVGVTALLGLTANPESPASVAVKQILAACDVPERDRITSGITVPGV